MIMAFVPLRFLYFAIKIFGKAKENRMEHPSERKKKGMQRDSTRDRPRPGAMFVKVVEKWGGKRNPI